jgi:hypothetical protein
MPQEVPQRCRVVAGARLIVGSRNNGQVHESSSLNIQLPDCLNPFGTLGRIWDGSLLTAAIAA